MLDSSTLFLWDIPSHTRETPFDLWHCRAISEWRTCWSDRKKRNDSAACRHSTPGKCRTFAYVMDASKLRRRHAPLRSALTTCFHLRLQPPHPFSLPWYASSSYFCDAQLNPLLQAQISTGTSELRDITKMERIGKPTNSEMATLFSPFRRFVKN